MDQVKSTEVAFACFLRVDTTGINVQDPVLIEGSQLTCNSGGGRLVVSVYYYTISQPLVIDLVVPPANVQMRLLGGKRILHVEPEPGMNKEVFFPGGNGR